MGAALPSGGTRAFPYSFLDKGFGTRERPRFITHTRNQLGSLRAERERYGGHRNRS